jgi:hypothetical protein
MKVEMKDSLLRHLARRCDQIHTLWFQRDTNSASNTDHRRHQFCPERWLYLPQIDHVSPWNDKGVPRSRGIKREECDPILVFTHNLYRLIFTSRNRAKIAILRLVVGRRRHLPAAFAAFSIQSPMLS